MKITKFRSISPKKLKLEKPKQFLRALSCSEKLCKKVFIANMKKKIK